MCICVENKNIYFTITTSKFNFLAHKSFNIKIINFLTTFTFSNMHNIAYRTLSLMKSKKTRAKSCIHRIFQHQFSLNVRKTSSFKSNRSTMESEKMVMGENCDETVTIIDDLIAKSSENLHTIFHFVIVSFFIN